MSIDFCTEDEEDELIQQWIEDRYNELIEKHGPGASGGPCHVSLDDGNYNCLVDDTDIAAYAIVRILAKKHDLENFDTNHPEFYEYQSDLYDDNEINVLFDTYLTMKNIVSIIGPAKLNQL